MFIHYRISDAKINFEMKFIQSPLTKFEITVFANSFCRRSEELVYFKLQCKLEIPMPRR